MSSFLMYLRVKDPSLWSQALGYFAKKEEDCKDHIIDVLNRIFFQKTFNLFTLLLLFLLLLLLLLLLFLLILFFITFYKIYACAFNMCFFLDFIEFYQTKRLFLKVFLLLIRNSTNSFNFMSWNISLINKNDIQILTNSIWCHLC